MDPEALAPAAIRGMRADAGVPAECEAFVDAAVTHLGGLDVLVNNAGIAGPTALVEHVTPEALDATLRIDLASMFHCSRRAIPALRAAGGGAIINLSSAAGRFGFPLRAPYSAAKWGVVGFTKTLSIELGPDGIRVNAILPGPVDGPRIRAVIKAKARSGGDLGKRDDRPHRGHHVAALLRQPAGHRQHGAVSRQPVRCDDQRPGDQRRWRHADDDVNPAALRDDHSAGTGAISRSRGSTSWRTA